MMQSLDRVTALLYEEAAALDERRWSDWLELFLTDCEYWAPAWKNEDEPTSDPQRELSLIYYAGRGGLEDRVWRVQSGRAASSAVLPRTQHAVSNIRLRASRSLGGAAGNDRGDHKDDIAGDRSAYMDGTTIHAACNWCVHQFLPGEKTVEVFFGRYEHTLIAQGDELRIARKKIVLLNDYLPSRLDFYNL